MKKHLILIFTSLLFLTGCVNQSHFVKINNNGKINYRFELSVPKSEISKLQNYNIDNYDEIEKNPFILFKEITKVYEDEGFEVEEIKADDTIGYYYSKTFKNVKEFNKQMEKLKELDVNGYIPNASSKRNILNTEYMLNGELEYHIDEKTKELFEDKDVDALLDSLKANLTVFTPTEDFGYENGTKDGKNVSFFSDATFEEIDPTQVRVVFRSSVSPVIIAGGGIVIGGTLLYFLRKRRR